MYCMVLRETHSIGNICGKVYVRHNTLYGRCGHESHSFRSASRQDAQIRQSEIEASWLRQNLGHLSKREEGKILKDRFKKIGRADGRHRVVAIIAVIATIALSVGTWLCHGYAAEAGIKGKAENLGPRTDWSAYNGDVTGDHYSPLDQITTENVRRMKEVWRFDAGNNGGVQTNPLVIGRVLYGYGPSLEVVALDGASGKQLWRFNSGIIGRQPSRGFTYWNNGRDSRLFAYIMNFVYALDPGSGKPITAFGENGRLDMRKDLGSDYTQNTVALTTPGVLYGDLLILGFRAPETKPAPRGDIRAYDVRTGKLVWSFHTIPHPGEKGYETWPDGAWKTAGAANNWTGMSVDESRGIVYVPTGSAVSDFYGGDRVGDDLFADTLLALDAKTGKMLWHFQGVHHDIWDRDFPSPPALVTIERDGKMVDGVAQTSKQGFVFVFDRISGKPLFPIEERPFPASNVSGEVASRTQPIPVTPVPFARQRLTADMLTTRTLEAHAWAVEQFKIFHSDGPFIPLSLDKQTVVFPGFDGGGEWGGPAVDPHAGIIYINSNDLPWTGGLTVNRPGSPGEVTYQTGCALCHGSDRRGNPPSFPSLIDIHTKLSQAEIKDIIHNGKGRMSGFPNLRDAELEQLLDFLNEPAGAPASHSSVSDAGARKELAGNASSTVPEYHFTGYRKFLDPDGYPAVVPPWGTLNAIDLNTGKYLWKVPLGQYPELVAKGMPDTGSENYGGPILTAGGVLFIGATIYDRKLRAFDAKTGQLLWQGDLPYAGTATPSTYMIDGRQYVVIATSGARDPKGPQGAAYVAFALP
jgi:quinoprotein glucose dehydrogenase